MCDAIDLIINVFYNIICIINCHDNQECCLSVITCLPNAVIGNIIFPNLSLLELAVCCGVSKAWKELAKKHHHFFLHKAFGAKEWFAYFVALIRNVPLISSNRAEQDVENEDISILHLKKEKLHYGAYEKIIGTSKPRENL